MEFFVSTNGNDSYPGTASQPFATFEKALAEARDGHRDATVHIRGGTYTLAASWNISDGNAEQHRKHVTFQAFGLNTSAQEEPVISAGQPVTDWEVNNGIWMVDVGDQNFHQLYVNGRKVQPATLNQVPGQWTRTTEGYTVSPGLNLCSPRSVQFVYQGIYPWTEARLDVHRIVHREGETAIVMAQPGWKHALQLYQYSWEDLQQDGPPLPTRIENDLSFLKHPGTFVLDRSRVGQHTLYYKPAEGERPDNTRITMPALECLVSLDGVRDISFKGLAFSQAAWLQPEAGFLHYYGDGHYTGKGEVEKMVLGGDKNCWVMVPNAMDYMPGCVRLAGTSNISFAGCRFTSMGGTALGCHGCSELSVSRCVFEDISASAILLTGAKKARVHDNLITRIGRDYPGSPALTIERCWRCIVSHNEITEANHSGVSLVNSHATHITNNRFSRIMGKLADGGAVHFAYCQGTSFETGAVLRGNVVTDLLTEYNIALYTDDATKWVTIEGNVVKRADCTLTLEATPPIKNVIFRGNYWDKEPERPQIMPEGVIVEDNVEILDEAELDSVTRHIQEAAGIRGELAVQED